MRATDHYVRFEQVTAVEQTAHGLRGAVHGEELRIDVVRADVVRVAISRGGVLDESPTFAVCVDPLAEHVPFTVEHDDGVVRLRTSALVLSLWLDPFRLDVHRPDGSVVVQTARDEDGRYWPYATLNDAFVVRRTCRPEDAIYGLGEKSGGHNRRGRDFTLWNTDVLDPVTTAEFTAGRPAGDPRGDRMSTEFDPYYVSIPFFYHHTYLDGQMAASFVDNGYRSHFDFTAADEYRVHFEGGQYTEYIFVGPRMPEILAAYTWLTGRTAPPPMWALGYQQCRWFDYTQESLEAVARRLRAGDVPCDALWLDIDYMDGFRVFTWDTGKFPDAPGMLARLAADGFRVVTIIDPGVKNDPGYAVFDEAVEKDLLCRTEGGDRYIGQVWPGDTVFPDFATPEARDWWGRLNAEHVRFGLAGIWNDMNEPATGVISPDRMLFDHGTRSHERFHNQYALLMAMGTTSGLLAAMPDRRTFVLSRAGFAGIQRYAANWMGDNMSRWDHLWMSMPMAMGLGLSGQSFVGADIGGFAEDANPELFVRWMQYGTLTPFCRNHAAAGTVDQYVWAFGDAVEELARAAIRLRYHLMPYLYASFLRASETGAPVQRPLVFDHQDDLAVRDINDEYLLGPDLLVAPVVEQGMAARQVYLPAGDWYDFHSGELVGRAGYLTVTTPMDRIPVFARGGAVIPRWVDAPPTTDGYHPAVVELHLYVPVADGTSTSFLQEDDGLTFAALTGARYRTTFTVARVGDSVTVRAEVDGAGYPEFSRTSFRLVIHGAAPTHVHLDGDQLEVRDDGVVLRNAGTGFLLEIELTA